MRVADRPLEAAGRFLGGEVAHQLAVDLDDMVPRLHPGLGRRAAVR